MQEYCSMASVPVKDLKQKLVYLYATHESIKNYIDLARHLKISPSVVAFWCNGQDNPYRPPEHVPDSHIPELLHLFGLAITECDTLTEFTAEDFKKYLQDEEANS